MNTPESPIRDPVCGMTVSGGTYEAVHEDVRYAFCSRQCLERFTERPGLYVGVNGRPAPGRNGGQPRRRRMTLSASLTREQTRKMAAALRSMMGVEKVTCSGNAVEITYDLLQATAGQLERKIAELGARLEEGAAEKLKRDFVRYVEDCELDDLAASPRSY